MGATTDTVAMYRDLVAEYVAEQASWRRRKAEEWPDDRRNERAARALESAADYFANDAPDEIFKGLLEFDEAMRELYWEYWTPDASTGVLTVDERGNQLVSRFWFGGDTLRPPEREPGPRDFAAMLGWITDGLIRSWRDTIENASRDPGFQQPSRELVEMFESWDAPLWEDEGDDDQ